MARTEWVCGGMALRRCGIRRRAENIVLRKVGIYRRFITTKPALNVNAILMPSTASSSRRTRARVSKRPSSDDIEEDNPVLPREDVDDDEEMQPPPPSRKKKGKRPVAADSKEGEDSGDDDDDMDLDNFENQPLSKSDGAKLRGLAQDWSQIRKGVHQLSFDQLREIAIAMADTAEGEAAEKVNNPVFLIHRC
jgi:hypothetical protein